MHDLIEYSNMGDDGKEPLSMSICTLFGSEGCRHGNRIVQAVTLVERIAAAYRAHEDIVLRRQPQLPYFYETTFIPEH